ncbi:MAG: response regulator [Endomicrobia bacterium]|nr:response regulator [Endomicrobiia bacterium]
MDKIKKVLIVDDEDDITLFMSHFLMRFDVENDVAKDGEAALSFLKNNSYSCVFLDLNLGAGISGFDILKSIKIDKPETAVIIISGSYAEHETMNMGADYFLTKPIDLFELKKAMKHFQLVCLNYPK